MVARVLSSKPMFRGLRRFNPAKDINGVAHLLEEAFRPDHNFPFVNVPFLREVGIALWSLNYAPGFPDATDGFVWVEDGKIVGNVTLNFDRQQSTRYYVSNVAVKPGYRRQGIARAMMQGTIKHVRENRGQQILLNVRPNNPGAVKLYQDLGFKSLETRGEWMLDALPPRLPAVNPTGLRPLRLSDNRAVSELLRAAKSETTQRFQPDANLFQVHWDEQIGEALVNFFTGQSSYRWVLEREGKLAAVLFVQGKRLGLPHKIAMQAHPDFRNQVEETLVLVALQELDRLPMRKIVADASSSQLEWVSALERYGFRFANGLMLMELTL